MAILAAIAVTAIVVGLVASLIARAAVRTSIGKAMGAHGGADPVQEHQRMLKELTKQRNDAQRHAELLELSLSALTSGVVLTDVAGNVLAQNGLVTTIASRAHEQALLDGAVADLLAAANRGEVAERELEIYGPPPRTLVVHAVPVTEDRKVVGALAVIDDVTDHHRIEKTRRDFVANLSHELRTPVGAASLLGEMLADEDDAATRKQLTDRLLIETDRMTVLIDDLLELSRIESAEQTNDQAVDLQLLINEALARTRVAAETKNVKVAAVLPADVIVMRGDRDQLLTGLVNLVENAIKYSSPSDSVSVRACIEQDMVHLIVQDTGRGIPTRDLDRIFERFYRVDRSRDSQTGGTGIGLSIVRHVALNHGGTVQVTSREGEGSTFTMILPGCTTTAPADGVAAKHEVTKA